MQRTAPQILLVEPDSALRMDLLRHLHSIGIEKVTSSKALIEAYSLCKSQQFALVLLNSKILSDSFIQEIRHFSFVHPQSILWILQDGGAPELEIMTRKVLELIPSPKILQSSEVGQWGAELRTFVDEFRDFPFPSDFIIGKSREIAQIFELIEKVADTDSTILLTGESGTGKELVAKAIHDHSIRKQNSFIPVNCAAIPSELLETELFGHIKGAFTGAVSTRQGRVEMADKGTLFLDEIGDLSLGLQVKILRFLQDKKFEMVGANKIKDVDVRIIAATHKNLEDAVKKKVFREDLYYRLNVIPIHIPPLRERKSDIPILVRHFIQKFNQEKKRGVDDLSPQVYEILTKYPWPGNIRELENLVERLVILKGNGMIQVEDIPEKYKSLFSANSDLPRLILPEEGLDIKNILNDFENDIILQALERTNWNRNKAAHLLKLNRTTLVEKLKKKRLGQGILDSDSLDRSDTNDTSDSQ